MIVSKPGKPALRHTRPSRAFCRRRHGLSLLELVIVLGLLAVLAATAIRSLQPVADQGRYEATRKLIEDCRAAIVGDSGLRDAGGTLLIHGASADCGYLPADAEALASATPPGVILPFAAYDFDSDDDGINDVTLSSGWNGPYLNLGVGRSAVTDGWGRPLQFQNIAGAITISSLGSDGVNGGTNGYEQDLFATVTPGDYLGSVVFRLFEIDTVSGSKVDPAPGVGEKLGIQLYGVNIAGSINGAIENQFLHVADLVNFEVRRDNVLHGTIAARGLLWNDDDDDNVFDAGESVTRKTRVYYLTVLANRERRVEMELR